jgi:periplasmic protein TonB
MVSNLAWAHERTTSGEAMRRTFTLFSIAVHAVVIAAALIGQVLADSTLPTPRQPLMFDAAQIMPVDIQPPARRAAPAADSVVSPNAAPTVAPTGVMPETGREGAAPLSASIAGVESGPPTGVEGVGGAHALPPPPPAAQTMPMRLHSGMKAPQKIVDVLPGYPAVARSARVAGVVILEAVIDAQGRVASVRVLRSIPLLDQSAVDAVQQWRFTPALLNGEAVPVVMTVTVNFTLDR